MVRPLVPTQVDGEPTKKWLSQPTASKERMERVLRTAWQVPRAAIRLQALGTRQVCPVAGHLLEVPQELNEADHAILVGIRILHLLTQGCSSLLVLQPTWELVSLVGVASLNCSHERTVALLFLSEH